MSNHVLERRRVLEHVKVGAPNQLVPFETKDLDRVLADRLFR
jgi:hypothetical protein